MSSSWGQVLDKINPWASLPARKELPGIGAVELDYNSDRVIDNVDVCVTYVSTAPPLLPVREELQSLGVELVYNAKGTGMRGVRRAYKDANKSLPVQDEKIHQIQPSKMALSYAAYHDAVIRPAGSSVASSRRDDDQINKRNGDNDRRHISDRNGDDGNRYKCSDTNKTGRNKPGYVFDRWHSFDSTYSDVNKFDRVSIEEKVVPGIDCDGQQHLDLSNPRRESLQSTIDESGDILRYNERVSLPNTEIGRLCKEVFMVRENDVPTCFVILPYRLKKDPFGKVTLARSKDSRLALKFAQVTISLSAAPAILYSLEQKLYSVCKEEWNENSALSSKQRHCIERDIDVLSSLFTSNVGHLYFIDERSGIPQIGEGDYKYPITVPNAQDAVKTLLPLMQMGMTLMREDRAAMVLGQVICLGASSASPRAFSRSWVGASQEIVALLYGMKNENALTKKEMICFNEQTECLVEFVSAMSVWDQREGLDFEDGSEWEVELSFFKKLLGNYEEKRSFAGLVPLRSKRGRTIWSLIPPKGQERNAHHLGDDYVDPSFRYDCHRHSSIHFNSDQNSDISSITGNFEELSMTNSHSGRDAMPSVIHSLMPRLICSLSAACQEHALEGDLSDRVKEKIHKASLTSDISADVEVLIKNLFGIDEENAARTYRPETGISWYQETFITLGMKRDFPSNQLWEVQDIICDSNSIKGIDNSNCTQIAIAPSIADGGESPRTKSYFSIFGNGGKNAARTYRPETGISWYQETFITLGMKQEFPSNQLREVKDIICDSNSIKSIDTSNCTQITIAPSIADGEESPKTKRFPSIATTNTDTQCRRKSRRISFIVAPFSEPVQDESASTARGVTILDDASNIIDSSRLGTTEEVLLFVSESVNKSESLKKLRDQIRNLKNAIATFEGMHLTDIEESERFIKVMTSKCGIGDGEGKDEDSANSFENQGIGCLSAGASIELTLDVEETNIIPISAIEVGMTSHLYDLDYLQLSAEIELEQLKIALQAKDIELVRKTK